MGILIRAARCTLALVVATGAVALAAQTPAPDSTPSTPVHPRPAHKKAKPPAATPTPVVQEAPQAPPPPPDWPANNRPSAATVDWNGAQLSITAANSSLQQILRDVSTATGVKVEGAVGDQRIFGVFGPATARDVLGQLLDGSGYNLLMIGERTEGTPRRLVLTAKSAHGGAAPAAGAQSDQQQEPEQEAQEDPEPPEQPAPPPIRHRLNDPNNQNQQQSGPNQPDGGLSGPQLMMQQMQQRQRQIEQQNQQQNQQNADPQPEN